MVKNAFLHNLKIVVFILITAGLITLVVMTFNKTDENTRTDEVQRPDPSAIVSKYSPIFCSNHLDTKTKVDFLVQDGFPVKEKGVAWTSEQCDTIVSKLYDEDNNETNIANMSKGEVGVGMTQKQLLYGWGNPDDINESTDKSGTSYQYIYPEANGKTKYVQLTDGKISSIDSF